MPESVEPGVRKRTFRSADRSGRPRRQNRGPSKCGNLFVEVAKNWISRCLKRAEFLRSSSGKPHKTWISRYIETAEHIRENRDLELPGTARNLDFQISQNSGTYSRKPRFRAPGNRPKLGFRGTSKQGKYVGGASLIRNPGNRPKSAISGP